MVVAIHSDLVRSSVFVVVGRCRPVPLLGVIVGVLIVVVGYCYLR